MRFSKQREMILNEVKNNNNHPTADMVYDKLRKDNPNLSLGTVYRNLTQLADNGLITKLSIPGDPVRFDCNTDEHNHFICEDCGQIFDIDKDLVAYADKGLEKLGFKVNSAQILLKGICVECTKKIEKI
ncbi:Fur family transcriptional regulator [Peptostreptococcus equinus]|uniref:Transcriptional repressor n=1 Tax=Peptostreptococcus equinus TaxID=3003601 RepID=A0ABY7JUS8_9FIRM|nr:transcriptional repressor [Peptostreptococcus sp. CBA3647]WAW15472.1 transcriptional repressor [Peptostreptococcus sp. CBA3647]